MKTPSIAGGAGDIMQRKHAEKTLQQSHQSLLAQQIAVSQLALALGDPRDLEQVYHTIYTHIQALVDVQAFAISFYDADPHHIRTEYAVYDGSVVDATWVFPIPLLDPGTGTQSQVIHTGQFLYISDDFDAVTSTLSQIASRQPNAEDNKTLGEVFLAQAMQTGSVLRSALYLPLRTEGKTIGVLQLYSHLPEAYTQADIELLMALANVAAIAVQNAKSYSVAQRELLERQRVEISLERRVAQLVLLNDIGERIAAVSQLDSVLERAAHLVQENFGYRHVGIFILDREWGKFVMRAKVGEFADLFPPHHHLELGQGMVGWVGQYGVTLLSNDVENESRYVNLYPDLVPTCSELSVPIRVQDEVVGVLDIQSTYLNAFDEDDVLVMQTLAGQIAVAIENAWLYDAAQQELAERKLAEEAFRESERRYRALFERANDGVFILTLDGIHIAVNRRAHEMLGYEMGELIGLSVREVVLPDEYGDSENRRAALLEQGSLPLYECTFRTKQGTLLPVEINMLVVEDDAGQPLHIQSIVRDLSARKQAEAALEAERALLERRVAERTADLRQANIELTRAARAKDEFLATMSHELRTPLTAILGKAETLQEGIFGPLNAKQVASLRTIEESGRHLLSLINDILDVVKIESDKLKLHIEPVFIPSVCETSLRMIKQAAHQKQIKIFYELDSKVVSHAIQADGRRLKQILVNLLSNAVKFTPIGGAVGFEVVGDAVEERLHFTVWDTGIGIAPEDQTRLFQPFVQLDSRLARRYTGTGLGLALVALLTEMHGGKVKLESEMGKGSRFTVSLPWLPVYGTRVSGATVPVAEVGVNTVALSYPIEQNAPLILLAEDNKDSINTFSKYLQAMGYRMLIAHNGIEAVQFAREAHPDLILMDIQMPEMDGLEATYQLRADPYLKTVPIIALTALAMPGDRERCLAAGVNAYVSKPVELRELLSLIENYLDIN
ncbi:MAG: GAF domain-containing protein [Anaerolineae bacterium]|nr:GAF domain-containing protein [Anaerolineae bacterium]